MKQCKDCNKWFENFSKVNRTCNRCKKKNIKNKRAVAPKSHHWKRLTMMLSIFIFFTPFSLATSHLATDEDVDQGNFSTGFTLLDLSIPTPNIKLEDKLPEEINNLKFYFDMRLNQTINQTNTVSTTSTVIITGIRFYIIMIGLLLYLLYRATRPVNIRVISE